jgi:hypothetical protein
MSQPPETTAVRTSDPAPLSKAAQARSTSRCQHRFDSGRQCRLPASGPASRLCEHHAAIEEQRHSGDLTALLAVAPGKFQSAAAINTSLGDLFKLLAKDRISTRRAAVLAYISSLLLRSLPAIEKEAAGAAPKKVIPRFIWDLPGPPRESEA